MSAAETWITQHEDRCAERYGELKATVGKLVWGVMSTLAAVAAWSLIQVYALSRDATPAVHPVAEARR